MPTTLARMTMTENHLELGTLGPGVFSNSGVFGQSGTGYSLDEGYVKATSKLQKGYIKATERLDQG